MTLKKKVNVTQKLNAEKPYYASGTMRILYSNVYHLNQQYSKYFQERYH